MIVGALTFFVAMIGRDTSNFHQIAFSPIIIIVVHLCFVVIAGIPMHQQLVTLQLSYLGVGDQQTAI